MLKSNIIKSTTLMLYLQCACVSKYYGMLCFLGALTLYSMLNCTSEGNFLGSAKPHYAATCISTALCCTEPHYASLYYAALYYAELFLVFHQCVNLTIRIFIACMGMNYSMNANHGMLSLQHSLKITMVNFKAHLCHALIQM